MPNYPSQHVDPMIARSFAQLASVAVKKHALESDPLLVNITYWIGSRPISLAIVLYLGKSVGQAKYKQDESNVQ